MASATSASSLPALSLPKVTSCSPTRAPTTPPPPAFSALHSSMTSMNSASSTRTWSSSPRPSYPPRPCSGLCPPTAFTAARVLLTSSPSRSSRGTSFCSACHGTLTSFARIPCSAPRAASTAGPASLSSTTKSGSATPTTASSGAARPRDLRAGGRQDGRDVMPRTRRDGGRDPVPDAHLRQGDGEAGPQIHAHQHKRLQNTCSDSSELYDGLFIYNKNSNELIEKLDGSLARHEEGAIWALTWYAREAAICELR
ncbi:Arogenate dehydrogenase [Musa troglodytarum]|uniref:Arogenate dehydrogenase n=1 Tax=Musa troglodytarum TaxID=320322 RepID=A0A9E7H427_9LILI|nr:Arogenate dehydrogenase [Musa troglodytarum]